MTESIVREPAHQAASDPAPGSSHMSAPGQSLVRPRPNKRPRIESLTESGFYAIETVNSSEFAFEDEGDAFAGITLLNITKSTAGPPAHASTTTITTTSTTTSVVTASRGPITDQSAPKLYLVNTFHIFI